ncbi:hypothetical protein M408DRAFT_264730 [Serendipita vermifera MAFF 305830]|uniref:Uncharacterized protein n=1 Tax=Serendipita vermifera MAFF 305830 TaxID=933852 RepID=A0A0C3AF10_SERVB|nr:hypothetical protein M408DRAFT_264730 [Serendipita vermifera MAFF 305830]
MEEEASVALPMFERIWLLDLVNALSTRDRFLTWWLHIQMAQILLSREAVRWRRARWVNLRLKRDA